MAALLVLTLLPAGPASAAPPVAEAEVRLVVRTETPAAATDVLAAATARGARPAGRLARLRAVAVDVPASLADPVRRVLLRRADVTSVDVARQRWLSEEPADPRFAEQRAYLDAVRATEAWGRPAHGSSDVRIAVVDSGVDVTHPDIAGKVAGTFNAVTRGTDVRDLVGHGTGVASVAAAATNNGEGISGAGYDSTLLVAKVADRTGRIFTDDLAAGIVWAADSGADVINLSLGGPSTDRLERDAVSYAQERGVLVVAAAGNDGTSARQYPAALPDVLSVGATSTNGATRASFSSFGSWVDVAAPGRGMLVASPGGGYEKVDGTSFSAPLVAGQVGLLAAYRPGRSAGELAAAVTEGANSAKLGFARGLVDFATSLDLLPPATTPTLTSPADGGSVSGVTTVSATSAAAAARLTLADLTVVVPVQAGVASASFETYGLAGAQPVTATDCSRIGQCAATSAAVTATVGNAAPVLTSPAGGSAQPADVIRATAEAPPEAAVRFQVEGTSPPVSATRQVPYVADLSTERLADGPHTVSAVLCRHDGSVCDTSAAGRATVSVDRLHPELTAVSVTYLSPNGDGRNDTVRVAYRLESRQGVTLRVRNNAGVVVHRRQLGVQAAGAHSVAWDGRGAAAAVQDGTWTLEVSTREPDGTQVGLASRPIVVDRARPVVRRLSASASTVFPVRDGYRDRTTVGATLGEAARVVSLEVRTPSGRLVDVARDRGVPAGSYATAWDGRDRRGAVVAAGRYSLRLVVEDMAGNRRTSAALRQTVSGQRLVRRAGTMTVTARESLKETFTDECSLVFRHTDGKRRGWVGYYSSGTCSSGDAYAVGDHQVRLPRAVRYGTVLVSAFGGRGDTYRDSARLTYYDRYENLSGRSVALGPRVGTHAGPRVRAEGHVIRNRVLRWATMTTGVAWYDVERYTVRYTYFVLR